MINRLKPSDFTSITYAQFLQRLEENFNGPEFHSPPDEEQQAQVHSYLGNLPLDRLDFYKLSIQYSDESHHHEVSHCFLVFHEYILVDMQEQKLYICVVGYD